MSMRKFQCGKCRRESLLRALDDAATENPLTPPIEFSESIVETCASCDVRMTAKAVCFCTLSDECQNCSMGRSLCEPAGTLEAASGAVCDLCLSSYPRQDAFSTETQSHPWEHLFFCPPTHHVLMLHGVDGYPSDFLNLVRELLTVHPRLLIHLPSCYSGMKSNRGIEYCADSVVAFLLTRRRLPSCSCVRIDNESFLLRDVRAKIVAGRMVDVAPIIFSVVAHSFGGVVGRSVVEKLRTLGHFHGADLSSKWWSEFEGIDQEPITEAQIQRSSSFFNKLRAKVQEVVSPTTPPDAVFEIADEPSFRTSAARVVLRNFITFATPHVGICESLKIIRFAAPFVKGQTGRDLVFQSPHLTTLCSDVAMDTMSAFENLTVFGNIQNDLTVGPMTSLLLPPTLAQPSVHCTKSDTTPSTDFISPQHNCVTADEKSLTQESPVNSESAPPVLEDVRTGVDFNDGHPSSEPDDSSQRSDGQAAQLSVARCLLHRCVHGAIGLPYEVSSCGHVCCQKTKDRTRRPGWRFQPKDLEVSASGETHATCGLAPVRTDCDEGEAALADPSENSYIDGVGSAFSRLRDLPIGDNVDDKASRCLLRLRVLPWRRIAVYFPNFFTAHVHIVWHGRAAPTDAGAPIVKFFADKVFIF